jgi:hypothetical protein
MSSLLHAEPSKPLFLIQPRLDAGEYREKLIGSVVKYPYRPTEVYSPYDAKVLPKDIVTLDPKPVVISNINFFSSRIKDTEIRASFNGILDGFVHKGSGTTNQNAATCARVWHMDAPARKFKELLKNEAYYAELFSLLKQNDGRSLYFIASMVTLVNMTVVNETGKSRGAGGTAHLPVDPSMGLNVGAHGHVNSGSAAGAQATYEGEMIVLLGYREVRLEKLKGIKAKVGRTLGSPMSGFTIKDGNLMPIISEEPAQGNIDGVLGYRPNEAGSGEQGNDDVVKELGYDIEIFGPKTQPGPEG